MLSFLLEQIWIGIDDFLLNFFTTSVQFWDYRLLKDRRLTVDGSHHDIGSHLLQAKCCVALSQ